MKYLTKLFLIGCILVKVTSINADEISIEQQLLNAQQQLKMRSLDEALESVNRIIQRDPGNAKSHYLKGHIYAAIAMQENFFFMRSNISKAFAALEQAVSLEPDSVIYRHDLMLFNLKAPSIFGGDDAIALEQALAITSLDHEKGLLAQLEVYRRTDEQELFAQRYAQAREKYPLNGEFVLLKAIKRQSKEKYSEAHELISQAVNLAGEQQSFTTLRNALYYLGKNCLLSESHIEDGIQALSRALSLRDIESQVSDAHIHIKLAELYTQQGSIKKAKTHFEDAQKLTYDPKLLEYAQDKLAEFE